MTHLRHKSYTGTIEYSPEDGLFFGKVQGIKSLISYEGHTGPELENSFQRAVDEYLEECERNAESPEKPFKGGFNVRVGQELHEKSFWLANRLQMSLNSFVREAIRTQVNKLEQEG